MKKTTLSGEQGLDDLFEKYRQAPDSYVFVPLADACRKMGRLDEALEICEKGVARHPNYASGHVVRGKCLYDQGDFDTACETFERVLDLDDNNLVALKFLGMIAADDGHLDTAQKYFQKILAVDPDNKDITRILRDVEEREQMVETSDVLVASTPDAIEEQLPDETVVDSVAVETRTNDDPDSAVADEPGPVLEGSSEAVETSEELASITLADIFASQGYASKAERIYREVLKKQPANDAVRKKLEDLTLSSGDEDTNDETMLDGDGCAENTKEQPSDDTPAVGDSDQDACAADDPTAMDKDEDASIMDDSAVMDSVGGAHPIAADPILEDVDEVLSSDDLTDGDDLDDAELVGLSEETAAAKPGTAAETAESRPNQPNTSIESAEDEYRPAIDETDSLSHFRQWLKQMQK
jgi:tetratricopeptide (TPR) repeat protein